MAEQYYLMSKDTGDGPYLIGKLMRLGKNKYRFEYMTKGKTLPQWFMQIPRLAEIKSYDTREVLHYIIYRCVPEQGEWAADILMKHHGIKEYDEWTLLETMIAQHRNIKIDDQPYSDSHQLFYFYSEIPTNANRYDV